MNPLQPGRGSDVQHRSLMPVVAGVVEDSPVIQLVRELGGNSTLTRGWLSSSFEDPYLEAAYQKDHLRNVIRRGRTATFSGTILLVLLALIIVISNPSNGPTYFYMALLGLCALMCFVLWLLFGFQPSLASKLYDKVVFCTGLLLMVFAGLPRDRVAKIFGLGDQEWSTTTFMEAACVLASTASVSVVCSLLHIPPRVSFALLLSGLAIQLLLTLLLGSMEWEQMSKVRELTGGAQGALAPDYCVLIAKQFFICLAVWLGSRFNEDIWRQTFAWAYFAVRKAEVEQDRNRALWRRLDEIHHTEELIRHALRPAAKGADATNKTSVISKGTDPERRHVRCPADVQAVRTSAHLCRTLASGAKPNAVLVGALKGRRTSWDRICQIATSIAKPEYTLRQYLDDCLACFPELSLYFLDTDALTSGGVLGSTEYQRTIGALFAVYWLLRLEVDGKVGFVYGVDENWRVAATTDMPDAPDKEFIHMRDSERKAHFLQRMNWSVFKNVVRCAGCVPRSDDSLEATVALLCLTAFHDIMKVEELLPTVQEEHGPYAGFAVGVKILDHDIALAYVLEHYPDLLPSFAVLPRPQQRSVIFTQCKLRFNHGWFVQAEAPPGALLSDLKQALSKGVSSEDIGLYFLHWVTDLAGAEATPLAGAEKLTIRFPHDILVSFLTSIPILSRLVQISETQLVEEYYQQRWTKLCRQEAVPTDTDAVARMRLVIMAQNSQVMQAYDRLPAQDREVLATEMSRTGCAGQRFTTYTAKGGPAILVYYGPALLQRATGNIQDLTNALLVLSETYRAARALWQVEPSAEARTVTVQIGELKSRPIEEVLRLAGRFWVLLRRNDLEATVESRRASDLNCLLDGGLAFRLLDFSFVPCEPPGSPASAALQ